MDKLKPCPFCGNEPTLYQDEMTGHWAVRCVKYTIRPTLLNSHGATAWCYSCTDPAEAIRAWNTRAERTCTIEHRRDEYVCTACGNAVGDDDPWSENFVNGNAVEMWAYCPHCGAKVIGGDAE